MYDRVNNRFVNHLHSMSTCELKKVIFTYEVMFLFGKLLKLLDAQFTRPMSDTAILHFNTQEKVYLVELKKFEVSARESAEKIPGARWGRQRKKTKK